MSNYERAYNNKNLTVEGRVKNRHQQRRDEQVDNNNNLLKGKSQHLIEVLPMKATGESTYSIQGQGVFRGYIEDLHGHFMPHHKEMSGDPAAIACGCAEIYNTNTPGAGEPVAANGSYLIGETFASSTSVGGGVATRGRTRHIRGGHLSHVGDPYAGVGDGDYGLANLNYGVGGLGAPRTTDIPVLEGDITPIKTWVATTSAKEDGTFVKGECPDALTGPYKSLPRKVTTFYTYTKEDVIKAITRSGQPPHVQRTMYAYIRKEQPKFSFPNNNVAGIQTDGGMFGGTTIADYDYQTCFKDAVTWRAFAGFNSLDRGMKTFGAQIAGKYASKFRMPEGTYEQQADTLVWNYYRSWNLAATEAELESLRNTGSFTRNGKTYSKGWAPNVGYFAKQMKDFDDTVKSMEG